MSDQLENVAMECATPAYLADTGRLLSNLSELREAVRSRYARTEVTYSVKTNPLAAFVSAAFDAGYHPEVVSGAELDYVVGLGADPEHIVLNGPSKTKELLADAIGMGVFVNVDSIDELQMIADLGLTAPPIGIRVSVELASKARSRFGIDLSSQRALGRVRDLAAGLNVVGIHIHHSSERSASSFAHRLDIATAAAEDLNLAQLEVIDIGGGFASDMPESIKRRLGYDVSTFAEYGEAIGTRAKQLLGDSPTMVVLEPGIGVLANTMSYVTTVQSTKERPDGKLAMIDGSIFEINPLRSRIGPAARVIGRGSVLPGATRLFGSTCMEVDDLGEIDVDLRTGDRLAFGNVGAYALTLAPDFIIRRSRVIDVADGTVLREPIPLSPVGGKT